MTLSDMLKLKTLFLYNTENLKKKSIRHLVFNINHKRYTLSILILLNILNSSNIDY